MIADPAETIRLIRERLPDEQASLLIRVRESVDKNAVADIRTRDLKRVGIEVEADTDQIVIRSTDSGWRMWHEACT